MTPKTALRLFLVLCLSWLPALFGRQSVASAVAMVDLALRPHPYFVPEHALLLYVIVPLTILSAAILMLSPGLLLTLALNAGRSAGQWIAYGLALSIIIVSAFAALLQSLLGRSLVGIEFAGSVAVLAVFCFAVLYWRVRRQAITIAPFGRSNTIFVLTSMLIVPMLILIALAPKFYWETFNGDGAHAFEASRLLLVQSLPFWPEGSGAVAGFPGLSSAVFVFPNAWFIRLFGEVELSARIAFPLYLVALFGILIALIEHNRTQLLRSIELSLVWLGLLIYVLAMAFSATYNPYFADIALPATQDTLLLVTFLALVLAFVQREKWWLVLFVGLTFLGSPNGLLIIGFWGVAVWLTFRPIPWRNLIWLAIALMAFFVGAALLPTVLAATNLPLPGKEYGIVGLLRRFAFLQFTDWHRLLYVLIPAGILPILSLFAWRRQDALSRAITLVTAACFFLFFFQAHISLHHFSPVMVLPLVVFWRVEATLRASSRTWVLAGTTVAGLFALLISLPADTTPHTAARIIGNRISYDVPGYAEFAPEAFRSSELLNLAFPVTWEAQVPVEAYGGSPLAWNYYANRRDADAKTNYILQPTSVPTPQDATLIGEDSDFQLWVNDEQLWSADLMTSPATTIATVYAVPRGILFRSTPPPDNANIINVVELLETSGINMDGFLERLGVKRD